MWFRKGLRRIGPLGTAMTLGQLAWALRQHWLAVPTEHRERLADLLRKSKGKPSNLSRSERRECRELFARLNLGRVLRDGAIGAAVLRRQIRRPS
jgi:hypothetical protein